MADAPPHAESRQPPDKPNDRGGAAPGTPRWVKVSAIVALILVVLLVVVMVVGGEHGPGRHLGGDTAPAAGQGDEGQQTPPSDTPAGHERPSWVPEH